MADQVETERLETKVVRGHWAARLAETAPVIELFFITNILLNNAKCLIFKCTYFQITLFCAPAA